MLTIFPPSLNLYSCLQSLSQGGHAYELDLAQLGLHVPQINFS